MSDTLIVAIQKTKLSDKILDDLAEKLFSTYNDVSNYLKSEDVRDQSIMYNTEQLVDDLNCNLTSPLTHEYITVELWG